jgi:hypothetical protein
VAGNRGPWYPVGPGMPRFTAFLLVLLVALPLLLTACGKGGGGY